jgi:cytochrome b pre-mRNA-processing protein 3
MLGFLFRGLTAEPERGAALFAMLATEARQPHWYIEGTVPDTIDGRFAVLATVMALAIVRLEQAGNVGNRLSVALTERFIEVMEAEHREIGLGDPTLGRQVRRLVGSLSRRVDEWRTALYGNTDWNKTARDSLYKEGASSDALMHSAGALMEFWSNLLETDLEGLATGELA